MPQPTPRTSRGYTLVEVLILVGILGLAAALVVPHMLAPGTLGVQSATRIIVADLIFAQNDAMARQTPRQMVVDVAANSYKLTDNNGATLDASWKGGDTQNYVVDFQHDARFSGVEILSASFGGDNTIAFDDVGAPDTGGTIELRFNDHRYRITVAEFTGRVTVEKVTSGGG